MKKAHRYLAQRTVELQEELDHIKEVAGHEIKSLEREVDEMRRLVEPLADKVDQVHRNQQGANAHMGWLNRMVFNLTGKSYRPHAGRDMDVDLDVKAVESHQILPK